MHKTDKYTKSCPASQTFSYNHQRCQLTCKSLSSVQQSCTSDFLPVDGCSCAEGLYLNEDGICVPMTKCSCLHNDVYIKAGKSANVKGEHWWVSCFTFGFIMWLMFKSFLYHLVSSGYFLVCAPMECFIVFPRKISYQVSSNLVFFAFLCFWITTPATGWCNIKSVPTSVIACASPKVFVNCSTGGSGLQCARTCLNLDSYDCVSNSYHCVLNKRI